MLESGTRNERHECLWDIFKAKWDDEDPRWWQLYVAYALLASVDRPRWAGTPGYSEAGHAVITLVEYLDEAFNVDGEAGGFESFMRCREAAATITRTLDGAIGLTDG